MDEHIYPARSRLRRPSAGQHGRANAGVPEHHRNLKPKARPQACGTCFAGGQRRRPGYAGAGLTNQEYAPLAEIMGRVPWASEVFNCSAPDTGNMETIARYGSEENKAAGSKPAAARRQDPLGLRHDEPAVASSDATNIEMPH